MRSLLTGTAGAAAPPRRRSVLLLTAVVAALACAAAATAAVSRPAAATKPTVVTVKAKEFTFVLSRRSIPAPGTVRFDVTNVGKEVHNFVVLSGIDKATPLIQPGKKASLTVTFKKPGRYTYECTVGEHANAGMLGTFVVK